jgi:hypothetical protein
VKRGPIQINPASVFVEECCVLTEKLGCLLRSIAESEPNKNGLILVPQKMSKVA